MIHVRAGTGTRAPAFLPLIYESKTLLMQRLQDAFTRGYTQWTMGRVAVERVPALARKFRDLYLVHVSRMARSRRKADGLGNAVFYLMSDGDTVLWFLLVTPLVKHGGVVRGEHPAHQLERLNDGTEAKGRLVLDTYELVQLTPTLTKPVAPDKLPPSPSAAQKAAHSAALRAHERRLKAFQSGARSTGWTWRYTAGAYQTWRDRLIGEVRAGEGAVASLTQSIDTLYKSPGFRGVREQVKRLAQLLRAEWKRSRRPTEAMPAIPARIGYVRRLPDIGRRVGDLIKAGRGELE